MREAVEEYLRYLRNRPAQWEPMPIPINVQMALCEMALGHANTPHLHDIASDKSWDIPSGDV